MVYHTECIAGHNCNYDKPEIHHNQFPTFKFPTKTHYITTSPTSDAITEAATTLLIDTLQPNAAAVIPTTEAISRAIEPTRDVVTEAATTLLIDTLQPDAPTAMPTTNAISSAIEQISNTINETLTDAANTFTGIADSASNTTFTMLDNTSNNMFPEMTDNASSNTFTDTATNLDNTNFVGIMEATWNSSITEILENGTLPINDGLTTGAGTRIEEIETAWSNSTTESIISDIYSSTDKIIKTITSGNNTFEHDQFEHQPKNSDSHGSIYIILGIILAILILMVAIMILVYVRYRKNAAHAYLPHQYYEIHDKEEQSPKPAEHDTKTVINDVYVQYTC